MHSAGWEAFRKNAIISLEARCAVCNLFYKRRGGYITVDHKRYRLPDGDPIFGREQLSDVRLLCDKHHKKGVHSDMQIFHARCMFLLGRLLLSPITALKSILHAPP